MSAVPDLAEIYSWPEGWWVRAMMVQTIDGAFFGPEGKSRSISSDTDRAVLVEARRLADVVLVGAQTIRAERYRPMIAKPEWQEARLLAGLQLAPVVAIVSPSLELPWEEPLFGGSEITPLVYTSGVATQSAKEIAAHVQDQGRVEIIEIPVDPESDSLPRRALDHLRERGYSRVVCEGGPRLLKELFPVIQELDLTISPLILGSPEPSGDITEIPTRVDWKLDHFREHEGFVFSKYLRA